MLRYGPHTCILLIYLSLPLYTVMAQYLWILRVQGVHTSLHPHIDAMIVTDDGLS